uniref:DUF1376 domain-containing protein n=1 Tax=Yoonia sp. TaxID=2212373 RepID=UPI004048C2B7
MRHGSEWYKREPAAYLGGVQGLSAKEHAVYSVVLDLIYAHGGSVNNDPSWVAGWIKDMGAASVRTTIASLVERHKLVIDGDQITEKRAKTEAKTKENLSETAKKNGKKGGEKSAELRGAANKSNNLAEPPAATENQADKIRLDKITDDDSARAVLTFRESVLEAAGHDRSGVTANGKVVGQIGEWAEFQKACDDLSISEAEALTVVAETTQRKRDGPATSLRYFKQPLQEFAGAKFAAPLNPITPIKSAQGARNERSIQGDAVVREIATRFADGRIKHDAYD